MGTEAILDRKKRGGGGQNLDSGTKNRAVLLFGIAILLSLAISIPNGEPLLIQVIWVGWLGIGLIIAGVLFRIWAVLTLGRFFTVSVQISEGQKVVNSGPYRWLRHPSYTGIMVSTAGFGLALQNLASLVIALAIGFAALYQRIQVEERVLLTNLGEPYENFCKTRKRLIPWVW